MSCHKSGIVKMFVQLKQYAVTLVGSFSLYSGKPKNTNKSTYIYSPLVVVHKDKVSV